MGEGGGRGGGGHSWEWVREGERGWGGWLVVFGRGWVVGGGWWVVIVRRKEGREGEGSE